MIVVLSRDIYDVSVELILGFYLLSQTNYNHDMLYGGIMTAGHREQLHYVN